MNTLANDTIEDIEAANAAGRPIRDHGPYHINIGDSSLTFKKVKIDDPVPTGQQLLEAADAFPTTEYSIFKMLQHGRLESIRPDETTDLRSNGVEKFLVFHSDASFRFILDGMEIEWGQKTILGHILKKLAGVDQSTYGVWQEIRGSEDREIGDHEIVNLSPKGVERFFTGIKQTTEGSNVIPSN